MPKTQFFRLRDSNQSLDPLIETGFLTPKSYVFAEIKEKLPVQKALDVGPPTAHQRYTISMAYGWWAVDGPTSCASWLETL